MQAGLEPQTGIVIHAIGWRTRNIPAWLMRRIPVMVRVFIDGKCVGVLTDKHAVTFPVSAGPHQVIVKRDFFLRSGTLDVSVPPGERAELECRYHYDYFPILITWAMLLAPFVLRKAGGLLFWPVFVVVSIGVVASGIYLCRQLWKLFIIGGYTLYLTRRAAPPILNAEDAPTA